MNNRAGEMDVFVQAVRSGSFSAAGRRLGLSPSAVSKVGQPDRGPAGHPPAGQVDPQPEADRGGRGLSRPRLAHPRRYRGDRADGGPWRRCRAARAAARLRLDPLRGPARLAAGAGFPRPLSGRRPRLEPQRRRRRPDRGSYRCRGARRAVARFGPQGPQAVRDPPRGGGKSGLDRAARQSRPSGRARCAELPRLQYPPQPQ